MLDPDVVLEAVVNAVRSVSSLATELTGVDPVTGDPTVYISGHYYRYGSEDSLSQAIYAMPGPSILIAYLDMLGGNFGGQGVWKHRLEAYIRPKNRAVGGVGGPSGAYASSPPHLFWIMMNEPLVGTTQTIRNTSLLDASLEIMDTPSLMHRQDDTTADLFVVNMVWHEVGDA